MMEARPHHLMKDFMDFLKGDVHEVLPFMILPETIAASSL